MHRLRHIEPGCGAIDAPATEVILDADVAGRRHADRAAGCLCGRSRPRTRERAALRVVVKGSARDQEEPATTRDRRITRVLRRIEQSVPAMESVAPGRSRDSA